MTTGVLHETAADDVAYDVAIVGFGPSGAVAAGLLGARGIRTFVCDRAHGVYDKPRAIALDHEITRLFQNMGVFEQIKPYLEPFTDSVFYGVDGQVIKRMSTVAEPFPLAHTPSVVFTQPPVERILRAHAASFPSVTIALGQQLLNLSQDESGVRLELQDDKGHPSTVRARYLIGCDGASSTVRTLAGIALEDLGFDEPWLVVDVLVNEQGLSKLPVTSVQYCHPERPATMVIGPGRHRRWEISINPGKTPNNSPHRKAPGSYWHPGSAPLTANFGAKPATASTPWWPRTGARDMSSLQAMRPTSNRPSSGKACAKVSATSATSAGS